MADILKSSFSAAANFGKVVFQRRRDVLDFELNELQDNIRYLLLQASRIASSRSGVATERKGFTISADGSSNQVTLNSGYALAQGIPIKCESDTTLTSFTTNVSGSTKTDAVYVTVQEVEIDDPNQVPQLGDTTRRMQIQWTVSVKKDWDASTNPIPSSTTASVVEGGIFHGIIALITRPNGQAAINPADVRSLGTLPSTTVPTTMTLNSMYSVGAAFFQEQIRSVVGERLVGATSKVSGSLGLNSENVQGQLQELLALISGTGTVIAAGNNVRAVAATTTLAADDVTLIVDSTGGTFNINLTAPLAAKGRKIWIADKGGVLETNQVNLIPAGGEKIEGVSANYTLPSNGGRWVLQSDGTDWYIWSC